MKNRLLKFTKKAVKETDGTATVEASLWITFFFAFLALVIDVSFIFYGQAQTYRILQDANRILSVGNMRTTPEVEAYITNALSNLSPNAKDVTAEFSADLSTIKSSVVIPSSDLIAVGLIPAFASIDIFVTSSHLVEY